MKCFYIYKLGKFKVKVGSIHIISTIYIYIYTLRQTIHRETLHKSYNL